MGSLHVPPARVCARARTRSLYKKERKNINFLSIGAFDETGKSVRDPRDVTDVTPFINIGCQLEVESLTKFPKTFENFSKSFEKVSDDSKRFEKVLS